MSAFFLFLRGAAVLLCVLLVVPWLRAVAVHGTVTDTLGRPIPNATVALLQGGKVIVTGRTGGDGSFQLNSSAAGQLNVLAGGVSFRQLATATFYGGTFDTIEQNIVLEPEWVRQSIVVTATGVPQPEAQVSASITTISKPDFMNRAV